MTIERDLYSALATHGALASLVGDRIYPDVVPQGKALPAVTVSRIATTTDMVFGDTVAARAPIFQLTVWARTKPEAVDIVAELEDAMLGMTAGSVTVAAHSIVGRRSAYDGDAEAFTEDLDVELVHV